MLLKQPVMAVFPSGLDYDDMREFKMQRLTWFLVLVLWIVIIFVKE